MDELTRPQLGVWKDLVWKITIYITILTILLTTAEFKNSLIEILLNNVLTELTTYTSLNHLTIIFKCPEKLDKDDRLRLAPLTFPLFSRNVPVQDYPLKYQMGNQESKRVLLAEFRDFRKKYKESIGKGKQVIGGEAEARGFELDDEEDFPAFGRK